MVAKNLSESCLQNLSKTIDFHAQNQPGRNPEFSASPLCPIFTCLCHEPDYATQFQLPNIYRLSSVITDSIIRGRPGSGTIASCCGRTNCHSVFRRISDTQPKLRVGNAAFRSC